MMRTVECRHGFDVITRKQQRQGVHRRLNTRFDGESAVNAGFAEHPSGNLSGGTRMTDTTAEPPEVTLASQGGNDVAQPVVGAMTAVSFEPCFAWIDIEFVVGNEHGAGVDSIIMCGARNGASAVIHISAGDEQSQIVTGNETTTDYTDRISVLRERNVEPVGELTH